MAWYVTVAPPGTETPGYSYETPSGFTNGGTL
jgi:hypothetical protein